MMHEHTDDSMHVPGEAMQRVDDTARALWAWNAVWNPDHAYDRAIDLELARPAAMKRLMEAMRKMDGEGGQS